MHLHDDRDIKIVPDDPSQLFDSSEGAAYAFKRESENGNMEKAKRLGCLLAQELLKQQAGAAYYGSDEKEDEIIRAQRPVLFAFMVNTVLADLAPNSIVAHSALSAFYDEIEKAEPALQNSINDPAAYSQYIRCARSNANDLHALGHIFARLCGRSEENEVHNLGYVLADYFNTYCRQQVLKANWIR